eukprot:gene27452-31029_t
MLDTARQAAETLDSGAGGWGASLHGQLAGLESRYGARAGLERDIADYVLTGEPRAVLAELKTAVRSYSHPRLKMHFVSNVDGHDMEATLAQVNPDSTLFIVASKTFTTAETMLNAQTARTWFLQHGTEAALAKHFVAVSTNTQAVTAFGIDPDNMFPFWDWVGGRYSVWSAIGLPVALAVGFGYFSDFLAGAHELDEHFRSAPLDQNLPVLLALIGFWNRQFLGCSSLSIAPYHQDLNRFPAYLQQLDMESNGKRVTRNGAALDTPTCPVVWGECGTGRVVAPDLTSSKEKAEEVVTAGLALPAAARGLVPLWRGLGGTAGRIEGRSSASSSELRTPCCKFDNFVVRPFPWLLPEGRKRSKPSQHSM